jgi:hypothetical protein
VGESSAQASSTRRRRQQQQLWKREAIPLPDVQHFARLDAHAAGSSEGYGKRAAAAVPREGYARRSGYARVHRDAAAAVCATPVQCDAAPDCDAGPVDVVAAAVPSPRHVSSARQQCDTAKRGAADAAVQRSRSAANGVHAVKLPVIR